MPRHTIGQASCSLRSPSHDWLVQTPSLVCVRGFLPAGPKFGREENADYDGVLTGVPIVCRS